MTNTVETVYKANISQLEIANDKLAARIAQLEKGSTRMTKKAVANASEYGRALKTIQDRIKAARDELIKTSGTPGFGAATQELHSANQQLTEFNKSMRQTKGVAAVAENSIAGLTKKINAKTRELNKMDNTVRKFEIDRHTGQVVDNGATTVGATDEYKRMTAELHALLAVRARLVAMQKIPVEDVKVVEAAVGSYNRLKESIERAKKARDSAARGSTERDAEVRKVEKLEEAEKRLFGTRKQSDNAGTKRGAIARTGADGMAKLSASSATIATMTRNVEYLEKQLQKIGSGKKFDRLTAVLKAQRANLQGLKDAAEAANLSMSKGATAAAGSYNRVEHELKQARAQIKGLVEGTAAHTAQTAKVRALTDQYGRLRNAVDGVTESEEKSTGVIGSVIGQMKSLALTYVGIQQSVELIREEWEHIRKLELESHRMGMGRDEAIVEQAANLGPGNLQRAKDFARDNQVALRMPQAEIIRLVGEAMTVGAGTIQKAELAAAAAAKLSGGNVEQASSQMIGALKIANINQSIDFEAALGQMRSSAGASSAVNEAQFIKNILPSISALTTDRQNIKGMSTERALEYITTIGKILGDTTGDQSNTVAMRMMTKFDEFVPKLEKTIKGGTKTKLTKEEIAEFMSANTADRRRELMESNKNLALQFVDAQIQGTPKTTATVMLSGQQSVKDYWKEAEQKVLSFKDSGKAFAEGVKELQGATENLMRTKEGAAVAEFVGTGKRSELEGQARYHYNTIFNQDMMGNEPPNLRGNVPDVLQRMSMYGESMGASSKRTAEGLAPNSASDMMYAVRQQIEREKSYGASADEKTLPRLEKIAEILDQIARGIDDLNRAEADKRVDRAKPALKPAPRAVAPAAQQMP